MSEDNEDSRLKKGLKYWFGFPDPENNHEDDVWSEFHLFDGHWMEIQNRREWYESPNVPSIYADHKYLFKQNMGMPRPEETYYRQNVDTGEFRSKIEDTEDLPSGRGEVRIRSRIRTKSPPSGENDFCMVEYVVSTDLKYNIPNGITFLPRIIARPLNRFFKWAFFKYIGEEMVDYDGEYARERTTEYFQYLRKYHGEEPIQTKSRQAEYKPSFEQGIFFQ